MRFQLEGESFIDIVSSACSQWPYFLSPFIPDATDAIFQKLGRGLHSSTSSLNLSRFCH